MFAGVTETETSIDTRWGQRTIKDSLLLFRCWGSTHSTEGLYGGKTEKVPNLVPPRNVKMGIENKNYSSLVRTSYHLRVMYKQLTWRHSTRSESLSPDLFIWNLTDLVTGNPGTLLISSIRLVVFWE